MYMFFKNKVSIEYVTENAFILYFYEDQINFFHYQLVVENVAVQEKYENLGPV